MHSVGEVDGLSLLLGVSPCISQEIKLQTHSLSFPFLLIYWTKQVFRPYQVIHVLDSDLS